MLPFPKFHCQLVIVAPVTVLLSVKVMVELEHALVFVKFTEGVGNISIVFCTESRHPLSSIVVSFTMYVPAESNV